MPPADITRYVLKRQTAEASNGTINREIEVLSRMLRLSYENGKVLRLPVIRKLKANGPRQGFFEREQYDSVCRQLPADLQVATEIAYTFGWRMQSEVLALELRQLDLSIPDRRKTATGGLCMSTPSCSRSSPSKSAGSAL
jgi:hypothetical protein